MNLQQVSQPRSSVNGFSRRRETGTRSENKSQAAKSNSNKLTAGVPIGIKGGGESLSHERLVYLTTCLIGHQVEVQVIDGSVLSGIFHATNAEKDFGIILKMARVTKASSRGQKSVSDAVNKLPSKTLIIPAKELVQIIAKNVSVTRDGLANEFQHEKQQEIMIDSSISQSRHVELERELERWVPDDDNPECPELENIFDRHWNRGWDQFEANETLFGVKSTFNEELYTTKLDRGPQMRELEREALRIAREIEGEDTQDLHLAEERGNHFLDNFDIDEETRYSSVFRGVDDSGYDENVDISDSRNIDTFGDISDSVMSKPFPDLTSGKSNGGVQDEVQSSQSSSGRDVFLYSSNDHVRQLSSERAPRGLSAFDTEIRIEDNQVNEQHIGGDYSKVDTEKPMLNEENQTSKIEDSRSSLMPKKENSDKGLSPNATAYAPSLVSSKVQEKPNDPLEGPASVRSQCATQPAISRARPDSSASSTSEGGNVGTASSGPGLSPCSSVGSLTSEKSTLNPHAKEFRLNPNAKSFVPVRPASPVSDGSFYYPPNMPAVPHMHGMPVGIGIGPSFAPHQPVIFGPQAGSMHSPQAYFHSNSLQYGQQMLQPRQVLYMPNYPPEMPYKGRDF